MPCNVQQLKIAADQRTVADALLPAVRYLDENSEITDVQFELSERCDLGGLSTPIIGVLERWPESLTHPFVLSVDEAALVGLSEPLEVIQPSNDRPARPALVALENASHVGAQAKQLSGASPTSHTEHPEPPQLKEGCGGWVWGAGIVLLLIMLSGVKCEGTPYDENDYTPYDKLPY
ncbi:hypothetical protein [Neorhodopirellula lusitana]|uniref:hypothetical protein n=1 Tax=Neorhodopirellula lusitana TaxID=445327 RepID=UPI0024B77C3E|nr:hypothetical protein [Neorhodopirellula lusitana]